MKMLFLRSENFICKTILVVIFFSVYCNLYSQQVEIPEKVSVTNTYGLMTKPELILSLSVLALGGIIFFVILFLIIKNKYTQNFSLKIISVSLIIIATLFCITAGFNATQIAPALGLFGTIAGYLLGKSNDTNE